MKEIKAYIRKEQAEIVFENLNWPALQMPDLNASAMQTRTSIQYEEEKENKQGDILNNIFIFRYV